MCIFDAAGGMPVANQVGERRVRPGSDPGEPVMIQEWRQCKCQHDDMEFHWFDVAERPQEQAEKIVEGHNHIMRRGSNGR